MQTAFRSGPGERQIYDPITDAGKQLEIGTTTLTIEFPSKAVAQKAVNNVRDKLNDEAATARHMRQSPEIAGLVTTRVVGDENGATAYVSMVELRQEHSSPGAQNRHTRLSVENNPRI